MLSIAEKEVRTSYLRQIFSLALAALTALLFASLVNLFIYNSPRQDQSTYLYWAQRAMSGAHIYGPQLVETNPPLIIWFSIVPVFLSNLLHINPLVMLKLVVATMIVASLAWSIRILRSANLVNSPLMLYVASASFFSAEIFLRGFDIGQREHLLVILVIPYVLSRACGEMSKLTFTELCLVGVVGGIAICFKPQQVLIFIGLELFIATWKRSLRQLVRPDLLCAVLVICGYVALVRLTTPYFSTIVPILKETYWAYGSQSVVQLIKAKSRFNFILLLAIGIFFWQRRSLRFGILSGAFLACCLASSIAFYVQGTGWTYQAYPFEAFLLLAVLWLVIDRSSHLYPLNWVPDSGFAVSTLVILLLLLIPLAHSKYRMAKYEAAHKPFLDAFLEKYPPQTPVAFLSTSVDAFPILPDHHLFSASRFAHLFMLLAIVQNEIAESGGPAPGKVLPPNVVGKLAMLQRVEVTEDLQLWKPQVVIVRESRIDNRNFDLLAWFLRSPAFAAEWKNYRLNSTNGVYDIYTRIQ